MWTPRPNKSLSNSHSFNNHNTALLQLSHTWKSKFRLNERVRDTSQNFQKFLVEIVQAHNTKNANYRPVQFVTISLSSKT